MLRHIHLYLFRTKVQEVVASQKFIYKRQCSYIKARTLEHVAQYRVGTFPNRHILYTHMCTQLTTNTSN